MGYYDEKKNVEEYVKMAEGYDGQELIQILRRHLKPGATVLELGIGPGKDFELLSEHFQVTGSDNSAVFLERYREKNAEADLVLLNAVTMEIERRFDCIYSNKVLHHLTRAELKASLQRQADVLNDHGILFHSFWAGDKEEEHVGLRFVYYSEERLRELIGNEYEVLEVKIYAEMGDRDSIYLMLQKK